MTILVDAMKYYLTINASGTEWATMETADDGTIRIDVGRINQDGVKQKKHMTRTYRESGYCQIITDHYNA
jgi:hypothetical protein